MNHKLWGVLLVVFGAAILAVSAKIALAGNGDSLCDTDAYAKPKNPVLDGQPIPDDPDDWEPADPTDTDFGINCASDTCNSDCISGPVKNMGPDPNNPGFLLFVKGCDCPEEGSTPSTPGPDPTGGDGQPQCVIGAKYAYNPVSKAFFFVAYICSGVCQVGGQTCSIQTGTEIWVEGVLSSADIECTCQ